ncbi:MAG TPA: transferrin receptor-like dimerization domain-containing protein [Gemmatimonadales bacterium]
MLARLLSCAGLLLTLAAATADEPPLRGYSAAHSASQREWETRFRAIPSIDSLREGMRQLTARPHHTGSPYDRHNAEWLVARFRSYGWDASIDTFEVLFPTPKERVVELVKPTKFRASLQEPAIAGDPTTSQRSEQLPGYNVYSIDGDVTAPLVYVNYGMPEDYERLDRMGISVAGAIALARYGAGWRGLKPKLAAEHGAVGCIIYSDPRNDGYFRGDAYPKGPFRPDQGVQRGSVKDAPIASGDPFTPFFGARPGRPRLPFDSASTLTRIPVLPISYADATPLLRALGGPVAPESWRGALPFTYHIGPGPAVVHLLVKFDWRPTPVYNVVARLAGSDFPGEWILRGNHFDAWVNGAEDPIAGLVAELEEARAFGELARQGWRPRRTLVYIAWDAEEPGLVGSTEFVEEHLAELQAHAVAYINTDGNGRGFLDASGSHGLERLVNEVAREIEDPETGLTVWKRLQLRRIGRGSPEDRKDARERGDLRIEALGSGSDYTPFLQYAAIASLNLGFGGEEPDADGVYHSIYDSFAWYTRFLDTSFVYGRALAQLTGTTVMRLADADLLPFHFSGFAETVARYLDEVKKLLEKQRDDLTERNRQLDEGVFQATADPRERSVPPPKSSTPPYLNFAPLENATTRITRAADRYEAALARAMAGNGDVLARPEVAELNALLIRTERALEREEGLPGRPWYRHEIYAPGLLLGYGVKTLPAIRETIEAKRWSEADEQIGKVAATLERYAATVEQATGVLEKLAPAP